MTKKIRYKFIFLAILTGLAILLSIPSLTKNLPKWWGTFLPGEGIKLGLDLQGGMHLLLKVDLPRTLQNHLEVVAEDLKDDLKKRKIPFKYIEYAGPNRLHIEITNPADEAQVEKLLGEEFSNMISLGSVRRQEGIGMDLGLNEGEIRDIEENAVTQSLEIIRNRIDQFGVTEPLVVRQGRDEIVVQLPGIKDTRRAIELVGKTAQLEFKLVEPIENPNLGHIIAEAVDSGRLPDNYTHEGVTRLLEGRISPTTLVYPFQKVDRESGSIFTVPILVQKRTLMTGGNRPEHQ